MKTIKEKNITNEVAARDTQFGVDFWIYDLMFDYFLIKLLPHQDGVYYQSQLYKPHHSSAVLNRGPEYRSERITQLGPLTVLAHSKFATRPSDSKTVFSTEQQQRQKISDSQR